MAFQDIMFQLFILAAYFIGFTVSLCNIFRLDELAKMFTLFLRYEKQLSGI